MKRYLPFMKGNYDISPGLSLLSANRGFGERDNHIFQFDNEYSHYHTEKIKARDENIDKYYFKYNIADHELIEVIRKISRLLANEYPEHFVLTENAEVLRLKCLLSDEVLTFDDAYFDKYNSSLLYDYRDGLDALCAQIQEDVALWRKYPQGDEHLALVHLSFPNHWSPAEKIGKNFNSVHDPVGGWKQTMADRSDSLVTSMINKGPFVRFAWGVATDKRLNHHPEAPINIKQEDWQGRSFDANDPKLFVRVERQTLTPLTELHLSLFTIRTYFYDVKELTDKERAALADAIKSMNSEELQYKGLCRSRDDVLTYLEFLGT